MSSSLKGKTVVITGASSGIGKLSALTLAQAGANLVLAARRVVELKEVANNCHTRGAEAYHHKTDVTNLDQVRDLYEFAMNKFGSIDIWINNAGVGAVGEFTSTPMEVHEKVIRTNLIGYMHGAYVILPHFKSKNSGILINNISLGAFVPNPLATAYSASKFGLRGFTEALRYELTGFEDIHICDVFPAFIDTPGFSHAANFVGKVIKPAPPVYDPQKVADVVLSLCLNPKDNVLVGHSARIAKIAHSLAPHLLGSLMAKAMHAYFKKAKSIPKSAGSVLRSAHDGSYIRGGWKKFHPMKLLFKH